MRSVSNSFGWVFQHLYHPCFFCICFRIGDSRSLPIESRSKLEELDLIYRGKIHDISDPGVGDDDDQEDTNMGAAEEVELNKLTESRVFSLAGKRSCLHSHAAKRGQLCESMSEGDGVLQTIMGTMLTSHHLFGWRSGATVSACH